MGLFTSISSYFDPEIAVKSQNTPNSGGWYYILSLYTYLGQTGEIEMDNLPYFTIFKEFSIFLWLFTSILSYFDPQIAVKSQNTSNNGG